MASPYAPQPEQLFAERGNDIVKRDDGLVIASIMYRTPAIEAALREFAPSWVRISQFFQQFQHEHGDLSFLGSAVPALRRLSVDGPPPAGIEVVNELTELRELSLHEAADRIDFARLPHLESGELYGAKTLGNLDAAPRLESLQLYGCRLRSLSELAGLPNLRRLDLRIVDTLTTLEGIEGLRLERLQLVQLRRLRSVEALGGAAATLRELSIDGSRAAIGLEAVNELTGLRSAMLGGPAMSSLECLRPLASLEQLWIAPAQAIADPSVAPIAAHQSLTLLSLYQAMRGVPDLHLLGGLENLRDLAIDRLREIPSIHWMQGLQSLESLYVRGTRISDGDLSVLLALRALRRIDYLDPMPKHYTHTYEQLQSALDARWAMRESMAS